ncbi:MAG: ECF-type sigma factor [Phycisphaerales bacterium]|nr:ECF-type sigma factor [Phycisphaerales bacterium]
MIAKKGQNNVNSALLAVYDEMRRMATDLLGSRRFMHTLPPTAVVHEAYLKVVSMEVWSGLDRATIFSLATRAMRNVLVDYARRRRATKRGGNATKTPLEEMVLVFEDRGYDLVELDSALSRLAEMDVRLVQIVELRFFGGFSMEEIAVALKVSTRTVRREWNVARAWLRNEYSGTRHGC